MKELFSGILDFSMFLELHFLLLSLSTVLLFTWFIVPYFYLTDFVMAQGLSETDASTIISTIGATNTVGMVRIETGNGALCARKRTENNTTTFLSKRARTRTKQLRCVTKSSESIEYDTLSQNTSISRPG